MGLEPVHQPVGFGHPLPSSLAIRHVTDDPDWIDVHNEREELSMTSGIKTVIFPVKDIAAAKQLYGELAGVNPYADEVYYVGFKVDGQDVGLDPNGHSKGMTGPVAYWHVDDINKSLEALLAAGAETQRPINDVGGGRLIATVKDPDGNVFGLLQDPAGGKA
jgi:predicted enzyme related to lactoylglutathione lyase